MAKFWKRTAIVVASAVLSATLIFGAACGNNEDNGEKAPNPAEDGKTDFVVSDPSNVTYRTYTTVMPSNWNELTYSDNNDTQIIQYLGSSFFEYDYEFDEAKGGKFNVDGSINKEAIVEGGFSVKYSAATALEDVTSSVDAKWGYTEEQKEAGAYAWKITLRHDLKWDDGTPIKAEDFVYTMKEQLSPDFFNLRANLYYNGTPIKNARNYLYGGRLGTELPMVSTDFGDDEYIAIDDLDKDEEGFYTRTIDTKTYHIMLDPMDGSSWGASLDDYDAVSLFSEYADPVTGLVKLNEESLPLLMDIIAQLHGYADAAAYAEKAGDYAYLEWEEMAYYGSVFDEMTFDGVGIYAEGDYDIVVCLDRPIQMLKEDDSLSYLAAYNFSSLPLVKRDLYESCKQEPQTGSTLWTTNYNSSLATTASWGPYKLTAFQNGKSYMVSRNRNWYGYALEDNKGQYKIDAVYCEKIADVNTQWMSFLGGYIDDIGLDVAHKDDYRNSKYTRFSPGTGTFGINLYSDVEGLKKNGHNAGVLAIKDFRQAISLFLDRDEYNQTCFTSHQSCYGLLGPSYYYDVENGGVYRDTQQAKETLLSVYGFTKGADGKWSDSSHTYPTLDDAYDAMNGMNRTLSKELLGKAWTELTTNAETYGYDSSKKITIVYGTSADNENTRRSYDYFVKFFSDLTSGTPFEGKVELTFNASFGEKWAEDFRSGAYEFAAGTGFSGGAFDPEGFLQCYMDPNAQLMYSTWWKPNTEAFTFTMPTEYGEFDGAGEELTMSAFSWYACLNGLAETYGLPQNQRYDWSAGAIPEGARMELLAALEKLVLEKYYTIITTSEYSASLLGAKFSHFSEDYNIFMGFGGTRYMTVNFNDGAWEAFVSAKSNDLTEFYKAEV